MMNSRLNVHLVQLSLNPNNFRPAFFYYKEIQAQSVHSFYHFKVILPFLVSNFKKKSGTGWIVLTKKSYGVVAVR